ncbi:hypothetical protein SLE2022_352210 [Rubroshorea leprosula]
MVNEDVEVDRIAGEVLGLGKGAKAARESVEAIESKHLDSESEGVGGGRNMVGKLSSGFGRNGVEERRVVVGVEEEDAEGKDEQEKKVPLRRADHFSFRRLGFRSH